MLASYNYGAVWRICGMQSSEAMPIIIVIVRVLCIVAHLLISDKMTGGM